MQPQIEKTYSDQVRVRAVGVLIESDKILMVKHVGLGQEGFLWIPPGGGVNFGDTIEDTIAREFKEETGLQVACSDFLFLNEFIERRLHAIEIFFSVVRLGGELFVGTDPEFTPEEQIIKEVKFLSLDELNNEGVGKVHTRFINLSSLNDLKGSKGVFNSKNIYLK